jgi:FkbM family methyltransferase
VGKKFLKKIVLWILRALNMDLLLFIKRKDTYRPVYISHLGEQSTVMLRNNYESELEMLMPHILSIKSGAVIDVGANVGQTMKTVHKIGHTGPYFGFEPDHSAAFVANYFIQKNKISNFYLFPIGFSDESAVVGLNKRNIMFDITASIDNHYRPSSFYSYDTKIYVAHADDIIEKLAVDSISFIKIDVEGAETEVLYGLSKTIDEHSPFIIFELLNNYLRMESRTLPEETADYREEKHKRIENFFADKKYCVYRIHLDASLEKITSFTPDDDDTLPTNYLACHENDALKLPAAFIV